MTRPVGRHVYIGGRDRGLLWLKRLVERGQKPLAYYCMQEDDHEVEKFSPQIVDLCRQHDIPCKLTKKLKADHEAEIAALTPDVIVVMGWRTMISKHVLSVPRFGAVGLHESLLPTYRGFAPVNWAVINGEREAGVSLFFLTSTGVDNGDIVDQAAVPIGNNDTAYDVYQRIVQASIDLLERHFDDLLTGRAIGKPQDESAATYTCSRTPEDGLIDWRQPTRVVHNLVRGLAYPYPGAFSYFAGTRYRIWSGRPLESRTRYVGRIPGRIANLIKGQGVEVLTGDGSYLVKTASEDGQPPQPADALFRSVRAGFQMWPAA